MMTRAYTTILEIVGFVLWQISNLATRLKLLLDQHRQRVRYTARPDDVFIVTYPKSGTTWLQMILYQLTSDGEMDFSHINSQSPHFEEDLQQNIALRPSPRIFKSHLPYSQMPKGRGKYIYVTRNGLDVAVSYYHHYQAYQRLGGTFDQFYAMFLAGKTAYGSWFEHVAGWRSNSAKLDVLFVRFEDLKEDLEGSIRRIAEFCNIELEADDLARVVERSHFDFMKQHEEKFDLAYGHLVQRGMQLGRFLRKGGTGDGREALSEAQQAAYKKLFSEHLSDSGLDDYDAP
ncbi:MAG: sulfotransferase domain-containing protein [Acidobacteriota bacterium]